MTQAESISLDDKKFTKGFVMKWSILAALLIMTFTGTAYATPTETTLFNLDSASNGGTYTNSGLLPGPNGSFYGTTFTGGTYNAGTVFQLKPPAPGGSWTEATLYSFNGTTTGLNPGASLISDSEGNLYGTTTTGGSTNCLVPNQVAYACGLVFKLSPGQNNQWTFTTLYDFKGVGNNDGWVPSGTLLRDASGNLYGTTQQGVPGAGTNGAPCTGAGCGTVFKLTPNGEGWTETLLHSFQGAQDGNWPEAGLIMDSNGVLYGTTSSIPANTGTVFSLTSNGGGFKTLYSFTGGLDGGRPTASLHMDASGNLYGTTQEGGAYDNTHGGLGGGTAFKLTPPVPPGTTWTESVIHSFGYSTYNYWDGFEPMSNLIADASGSLYGTTLGGGTLPNGTGSFPGLGTVFKLTPAPDGTWTEAELYSFQGPPGDGDLPNPVVFGAGGALYGTTYIGGSNPCPPINTGCGTVFQLKPN